MNEYFTTKIECLQEKNDPTTTMDPYQKLRSKMAGRNMKFAFRPVSKRTVKKIIRKMKLKSSAGPDGINPQIVKLCVDVIVSPLTHILNRSLQTGKFPTPWKLPRIVPVFKRGSREECINYTVL